MFSNFLLWTSFSTVVYEHKSRLEGQLKEEEKKTQETKTGELYYL